MTETARGLVRLGLPHDYARAGAAVLSSAGLALLAATLGMWLEPRVLPIGLAWLAIALAVGRAIWAVPSALEHADPRTLGRLVEHAAGARSGSVIGVLGTDTSGALLALADARAASVVRDAAPLVELVLSRETRRRLVVGGLVAATGAAIFLASSPASGHAAFWHPLRTLADARAPVRLALDRTTVRRGDSVTVTLTVPAATRATLWTRAPGESWLPASVALDPLGRGVRRIGPLETDLYVRATSGTRRSGDRKISVTLPPFLADLELTARFPAYLERGDEPIPPGTDTVPVPAGTVVITRGSASVALSGAAWTRAGGARAGAGLVVSGDRFSGRLEPLASGTWRLALRPADGGALEGDVPELHLRVIPDSGPLATIVIPGRDTTLPITLRQPLVVDARDDHGISRLEIVSWRVSQTGKIAEPAREAVDVASAGAQTLVQGELDARSRGLLPGDTLRVRVDVWDNAPEPHASRSGEVALRLSTLEELRAATRVAARDAAGAVDSLAGAAADLSRRTADLAGERVRDATPGQRTPGEPSGALSFAASERATAIADQMAALEQRARDLAEAVRQIARAAEQAGLTDTAFQARLREVQQLLQRALTPELAERLQDLRAALERLDPDATRQALERLADAQRELKDALERSRELFQRAAVEGDLATLAADAEALRQEQHDWVRGEGARPDSAAAQRERALAARADSLGQGIARAARDMAQTGGEAPAAPSLTVPADAAARAARAMRGAAEAADAQNPGAATGAGAAAESSLAQIPDALRARRDSATRAWRQETLDALDRALSEGAALAARELNIASALRRGETGAALRSGLASVEEGAQAVSRQIRDAAGRNALVSPDLAQALGFAQRQVRAAREELESGHPNGESAATLAEQGVDALNVTVYALLKSRDQVQSAQSGSGFAEAMEQLARLAGQQAGLNGETRGLLPMGMGSGAVLERLRSLAAKQRALADQLDRLQAEGASDAAGGLGREARDLARQLEAGRLDRQTIERQERLYHRLLDAGRTLTGSTPDEDRARVSQAAVGDSAHVPAALAPGATGAGPRLRYPTWEELQTLTAEQRRLVLEYFRRLNAP